MTLEKTATVEITDLEGPFDAKHVGENITKTLENLNLKEGQFQVTATVLGATDQLPDGEPVPDGSFALSAAILQLGGGEEERDENLVRAFGMIGVELLNRGFPYPSLLTMVEQADAALNGGRHGSIEMIDATGAIKNVMEAISLAGVDDENIPQA
jgi:hypothetical protein